MPFPTDLKDAKPQKYIKKVKEIPPPVLEAVRDSIHEKEFQIADNEAEWNSSTYPSPLPFRRLIWAVQVKGCYVIHYEMGGSTVNTHYLVVGPGEDGKKWKVLWSALSFSAADIARDYSEFMKVVETGDLKSNPANFR